MATKMAHRTIRLSDEDERNIARIQEHFRRSRIPVEVHWNEVIRTGLRELAQRLGPDEKQPNGRSESAACLGDEASA